MKPSHKGTLGDILLSCGIITEDDVRTALEEQKRSGKRFGEALVSLGIVSQEDIEWGLSTQLEIPFVRLRKEDIDPGAVSLVPPSLAWKHDLIPLIRIGDELKVAMADPLDRHAIEAVERSTGCTVTVSVALPADIHRMLEEFCGPREQTASFGFFSSILPPTVTSRIDADPTGRSCMENLLLFSADNHLASLTLLPTAEGVTVMGRKGDQILEIGTIDHRNYHHLVAGLRIDGKVRSHGDTRGEGLLDLPVGGTHLSFTVQMLETLHGTMVTVEAGSVHPPGGESPPLFPAERELLHRLAEKPGIAALCGETAGDVSTLVSLLLTSTSLRSRSVIVIGAGLDDALLPLMVTIPPPPDGEGLDRLILAALRHAPDVIVVEDGSDPRSFRAAVRCAMEGMLVILGYGGGNGAEFRHRLSWLRERYLPGPLFNGALRGRHLRLLCRSCRRPLTLTPEEASAIHPLLPAGDYRGAPGCRNCHHAGHSGVRFVILPLPEEGKETDVRQGAAWELLAQGEISPEEFSILLLDDGSRRSWHG